MATKTWKLGEWAKGGIITVNINGKTVTIIGKEWDFKSGTKRGSKQSNAKEFIRKSFNVSNNNHGDIRFFLNDLTTSYYSDVIMDWIKVKTKSNTMVNNLVVLLVLLLLVSCTYSPVTKDTQISKEISEYVMNADSSQMVYQYCVKTKDYHYYFNSDKQLIEKYNTNTDNLHINIFVLWASVLFIMLLIYIFSFYFKK